MIGIRRGILLIILSSTISLAGNEKQPDSWKNIDSPKNLVEAFLDGIVQGRIETASVRLFSYTLINQNAISILKKQMEVQLPLYGKISGKELISENRYTSKLVRLNYVLYTDYVPVYWVFHFYFHNQRWELTSIHFKDDAEILAE